MSHRLKTYEYSAFGEPVVSSGELAASFTHQFSTKPYCAATGFSEYPMRKYRPEIGRWMSRDPIGERKYYAFAYIFSDNVPICDFDYLGLDSPNLGGPLLPGLTPAPTSPNQLDKPQNCGKPCPCGEGKDSTGTLRCTFVKVSPSITGGPSNFATHQIHKNKHSDNEDRSSKPQCWNPSFCFNEEPTCPEGWTPYGHRSFLTDGIKKVTRTKPAWDFNNGKLSDNCYEMSSTDWVISTSLFLGRWCTKCE